MTSLNVDENGWLPYKPRQLSAMARFDRWRLIGAGTGPVLGRPASPDALSMDLILIQRQIARSAENYP
jgi:hypothetical protein